MVPGSHGQQADEIIAFAKFAEPWRPRTICEIGTLMGGTSLFLTWLAPTVELFVGIDLVIRNAEIVRALSPQAVDVVHVEANSRAAGTLDRVVAALDGRVIDLLFIDGDHEYGGVRGDFATYRTLVSDQGLIAFHDIVDDRGQEYWAGGVPLLWRELADRFTSWEFINDPAQDAFGIGVIKNDPFVSMS